MQNEIGNKAVTVEPDEDMVALFARVAELQGTGLSERVAFDTAVVEERIARWPEEWGGDLQVLIYGDFDAPDRDLDYPTFGITVMAGKYTNTSIKTARCVVSARVKVSEKSLLAVWDAVERLNTFLGIWAMIGYGNQGVGWWCHLTSGNMAGTGGPFEKNGIDDALAGIQRLPSETVKRKVKSALYWMREPSPMMLERFKNNILNIYAGYWNAFECLVEAVCLMCPHSKMNKQEKQDGITNFLADKQGKLNVESLADCYRCFVNPGFVAKASHALTVCCPDRAGDYINECFHVKPEHDRLYAVRNAINHGDIDSDSMQEMFRVEDKFGRLHVIVFAMLGCLIQF